MDLRSHCPQAERLSADTDADVRCDCLTGALDDVVLAEVTADHLHCSAGSCLDVCFILHEERSGIKPGTAHSEGISGQMHQAVLDRRSAHRRADRPRRRGRRSTTLPQGPVPPPTNRKLTTTDRPAAIKFPPTGIEGSRRRDAPACQNPGQPTIYRTQEKLPGARRSNSPTEAHSRGG